MYRKALLRCTIDCMIYQKSDLIACSTRQSQRTLLLEFSYVVYLLSVPNHCESCSSYCNRFV